MSYANGVDDLSDGPSGSKRPRLEELNTANATKDEILAALGRDTTETDELDEAAVKRMTNQLEKKVAKNRELRIKYADEPSKFLESEMELNNAVQDLYAMTAQVELYPVLVKLGTVQLILQLLGHENTDIVAVTCNLLQELTDTDTMYENEDCAKELIDELVNSHIIETIVQQALKRLNEEDDDESDAVQHLLTMIENLLEFRPELCQTAVDEGLFQWILLRATRKSAFDPNKLSASQHLAVILQNSEDARVKLVEKIDGIDMLLRALALYKKTDPPSRNEMEHMENLFDALCTSLLLTANRQIFLENEGPQLMNLMLREKKKAQHSALKVLSYATAIPDGGPNCDKFVEIYGIRTLFPLFMKTPTQTKKKDTQPMEDEEHACSIIDALLFQCDPANRDRVVQKFAEHQFEKVDRTVELLLKYRERVEKFTERLQRRLEANGEEMDPDDLYAEQLNNGLYTLQRVALILAEVCCKGPSGGKERAAKLLKMKTKKTLVEHLVPILEDLHSNLPEEAEGQRSRLTKLISMLGDNEKTEDQP